MMTHINDFDKITYISQNLLISAANLLSYYVNRFCRQNGSKIGP